MSLLPGLLEDLRMESEVLLMVLEALDTSQCDELTEAAPWTIKDHVAHLAFFDDQQRLAIVDPPLFAAGARQALSLSTSLVDVARDTYADEEAGEVFEWFETSRADLLHTFKACNSSDRLEWFGPSMSVASAVTARLMETWAHGVDITDALGRPPTSSDRLRHVARLAHRARPFAYESHRLEMPPEPLRFELTSPTGELWSEGDEAATSVIVGPALDLCLVATQRRHVLDTELVCSDTSAAEWLGIAQTFAGPAGPGRPPRVKP